MKEKYSRGISRSSLAYLALLVVGDIVEDGGTAFNEYFVPEFGDPPYDGEDDTFSDKDTEHISCNLPTVCTGVEELVSFA